MSRYVGRFSRKRKIPLVSTLLMITAVLSLMVGGVTAYLSTRTEALKNTFEEETAIQPTVVESMKNNVKTDVAVNVGDPGYAVYVRAAVVVTWKDENGNVLGKLPKAGTDQDVDKDYTINYNLTDWFYRESDGFYYHKAPVAYDGLNDTSKLTNNLINRCTPVAGRTPAGYGLNVEIIAQTIQAVGTTDVDNIPAVEDAWGIEVDGSNLEN